jgi:O-antigen/teichoic acid export membrane protein
LICAAAFLVASPLVLIGFFAWGVVLVIITALLAAYFRRAGRKERAVQA